MTTPTPTPGPIVYAVPAAQMQAIVNTLVALPWHQVNGIVAPLLTLIKEQEAAPPAV